MSNWTLERLNQLIADGVEESSTLEYKRADALNKKDDKQKAELIKQVTAMANSAGGTLIYGIAEYNDKKKSHLPEKLDPLDRSEFSRESLDSIIQSIQPRIDGVIIHPIADEADPDKVYYVVEVPASQTAHQVRDLRYYRRRNFQVQPMEDYEVRDVMNRRSHPRIQASIYINRRDDPYKKEGLLLVKIENMGSTMATYAMADLSIPVNVNGFLHFGEDAILETSPSGKSSFRVRLKTGLNTGPLFPGSSITLKRKFKKPDRFERLDGIPTISTETIEVTLYADEMPFIKQSFEATQAIKSWVTITPHETDSTL